MISAKKNFIYNSMYQIITIILPVITMPYVSRILGPHGLGTNSYTSSIVQYFVILGTIGIVTYGSREIAYVRDDKEKLTKTFWEIFALKLLTTLLAYIIFFIIFYFVFNVDDKNIYFIQSINILAATIDITWFFAGIEDFKTIVIRNIIIKFVSLLSIFIFIKTSEDLWKYILILTLSNFIGQVIMWLNMHKELKLFKIRFKDLLIHVKPSLILFLPQIAVQMYLVVDKTMLGFLASKTELGYYDNAEKIVKMTLTVATSLGVVMLPRVSNSFAKGDYNKVEYYLIKSFDLLNYLVVPMMFGFIGISYNFVYWFFGVSFLKSATIISVISPIVLAIAWSNALGVQYLLPIKRNKEYTISVTIGAIINLICNIFLIKYFASIGASIATVLAEFSVAIVQLYFVSKHIQIKRLFNDIYKYIISSLVMLAAIIIIGILFKSKMTTTFVQIIIGIFTYVLTLFLLRSETNNYIFSIFLNKFSIKNKN